MLMEALRLAGLFGGLWPEAFNQPPRRIFVSSKRRAPGFVWSARTTPGHGYRSGHRSAGGRDRIGSPDRTSRVSRRPVPGSRGTADRERPSETTGYRRIESGPRLLQRRSACTPAVEPEGRAFRNDIRPSCVPRLRLLPVPSARTVSPMGGLRPIDSSASRPGTRNQLVQVAKLRLPGEGRRQNDAGQGGTSWTCGTLFFVVRPPEVFGVVTVENIL